MARQSAERAPIRPVCGHSVSLLPYHEWGRHKYKYLGRVYPFRNAQFINEKVIQGYKQIFESYNLTITTEY